MEAQQGFLQVPRAARTHEVLEGPVDSLPATLHGEGAQPQLSVIREQQEMWKMAWKPARPRCRLGWWDQVGL